MLAAIEACTGARAETVVDKPSRFMAQTLLARLGVAAPDVAVVGDRLSTDVVMGKSVGAASILVLTAATSAAAATQDGVEADYVTCSTGSTSRLPGGDTVAGQVGAVLDAVRGAPEAV